MLEQERRDRETVPLPARQLRDGPTAVERAELQACEHGLDAGVELPEAELLGRIQQPRVLVGRGRTAVGKRQTRGFELALEPADGRNGGRDDGVDRRIAGQLHLLPEEAELGGGRHVTVGQLEFARER
nr:hypothetical protein [Gulosibacter sediminis]